MWLCVVLIFPPLFRSSVGFDQLARVMDNLAAEPAPAYPPYNIEVTGEDTYRITMAVAGFSEENLNVEVHGNKLKLSGRIEKSDDKSERKFLHHGIAERAFERQFSLADHINVVAGQYRERPASRRSRTRGPGSHEAADHRNRRQGKRQAD